MTDLSMWVITENPTDFPGQFVARQWLIGRGLTAVTDNHHVADTLEAVRAMLPEGLFHQARNPADVSVIVECWI